MMKLWASQVCDWGKWGSRGQGLFYGYLALTNCDLAHHQRTNAKI